MLQQFTLANWASFKDEMTLSLEASSDTEHDSSVFEVGGIRLLKSAVIYGANASGKSNLLSAINFMRLFVLTSSRETQVEEQIQVEPFRLSSECDGKPSFFEVIFFQNGIKYRYGFEADTKKIASEWLFATTSSRESELFTRTENKIEANTDKFKEGKGLEEKTRSNALYLSVVAGSMAKSRQVFLGGFIDFGFIAATRNPQLRFTIERLNDPDFAKQVLEMTRAAGLGIDGIAPRISNFTDADLAHIPEQARKNMVGTV